MSSQDHNDIFSEDICSESSYSNLDLSEYCHYTPSASMKCDEDLDTVDDNFLKSNEPKDPKLVEKSAENIFFPCDDSTEE